MRLTYDPAKSQRNEAERGLPFALAEDFDWSSALIAEDTREDYQEKRYRCLAS
ncbi:MAG TPA: BrnT family toxin [Rhodoferax sp.]